MPEPRTKRPLNEWIGFAYKDRGGWKPATEIFGSLSPYETKMQLIQEHYTISRATAVRWYIHYRAVKGLR